MCTLSWIRRSGAYELAFNRDERLERVAAQPPRTWSEQGVSFIGPRDPEGGGTWIATNESGVTCCLLNNYEADVDLSKPADAISRGQLVTRLAASGDASQLRRALGEVELRRFSPFVLVLFELQRSPCAFVWNGRQLQERLAIRPPISTSGYRHADVVAKRRRAFEVMKRKLGRPLLTRDLLNFQRSRAPWAGAAAVAMRRPGFGSVSLTHVEVSAERALMRYWPGDPARSRESSPQTRELAIAAPRSGQAPSSGDQSSGDQSSSIDVREVFEAKNPTLARRIPRVGFRLLEEVVRQRRINGVLRALDGVAPLDYPEAALEHLGVEVRSTFQGRDTRAQGAERGNPGAERDNPVTQPIYVSNHPLGGLDGLALLAWVLRRHGRAAAPVNDVLWRIEQLQPYLVPLDRERGGRALLRSIDGLFRADAPVLLFPAGRTSRMLGGRLLDGDWGRMVIQRALSTRRAVVPIFVSGQNSRRFYALAAVRRALKVETNVEMFLLPRELLSPSVSHVQLTLGSEILPAELRAMGSTWAERAAALRRRCYSLDAGDSGGAEA